MAYLPHDNELILGELGIKSPRELFKHIPQEVFVKDDIRFEVFSEKDLIKEAKTRAAENFNGINFTGYGLFTHEVPTAVNHVSNNRNFVTSYTPYQPEVAQGTLQALFEYQSLMTSLTSMDVVNASMYDGATAIVEAIRMDLRQKKSEKNLVLLSEGIYPYILDVIKTYFPQNVMDELGIRFEMIPLDAKTGSTRWENVASLKEARTVVVMNPTRWGTLEQELGKIKKINTEISVIYGTCEVLSLSVLPAPLDYGVDIVCGDAQSLGIPVSFGGPSLGFLAVREVYMRQMPGRLIGKTQAKNRAGENVDSYVITLSTREQHIRREKATSNICSNQSLMAVRAAAYMAFMGWEGMQKVCVDCRQKAAFFKEKITQKGFALKFPEADYFHEISWVVKNGSELLEKGFENGMCIGHEIKTGNSAESTIVSYFSDLHEKSEIEKLLGVL